MRLVRHDSDNCHVADSVEAIAYEQAIRAIEGQSAQLESLRGRASTILSAASLVTAFLGGLALASPTLTNGKIERPPLTNWTWTAIGSFVAVVVLSLGILWPYRWYSQISAELLLRTSAQARATVTEIQRDLARFLDANRTKNQRLLFRLVVMFSLSCFLLLSESVAWIVNLT
jgi:hypothetical protein